MELSGVLVVHFAFMKITVILLLMFGFGFSASAKQKSILFIGNSYTYYPFDPSKPGIPLFVQEIAKSIDKENLLVEACNAIPNANLEVHFNNLVSRGLIDQPYDEVVVQGRSTDPLKVPTWFQKKGLLGLESFRQFLPKMLDLILEKSSKITLFVPWGYHPNHEYFKSKNGEFKDVSSGPDEWSGQTGQQVQDLIDKGYIESARGYPVTFSFVGDEWLYLVQGGIVKAEDLYVKDDWSHPSPLGSMVAALVLARDVLHLNISTNKFVPVGLDPVKVEEISRALSHGL